MMRLRSTRAPFQERRQHGPPGGTAALGMELDGRDAAAADRRRERGPVEVGGRDHVVRIAGLAVTSTAAPIRSSAAHRLRRFPAP